MASFTICHACTFDKAVALTIALSGSAGMRRLVGSIGLMPLTFLIPPALWIKVHQSCC